MHLSGEFENKSFPVTDTSAWFFDIEINGKNTQCCCITIQ